MPLLIPNNNLLMLETLSLLLGKVRLQITLTVAINLLTIQTKTIIKIIMDLNSHISRVTMNMKKEGLIGLVKVDKCNPLTQSDLSKLRKRATSEHLLSKK